jgi:hypothetical protein
MNLLRGGMCGSSSSVGCATVLATAEFQIAQLGVCGVNAQDPLVGFNCRNGILPKALKSLLRELFKPFSITA